MAGTNHVSRGVQRLVEVVLCSVRVEGRPEQLHRLLAVEPAARLEREHLDERSGLPQSPGRVVDLDTVELNREPPQQANRDAHAASLVHERRGWKPSKAATPGLRPRVARVP